jgi:hypothetical protein
LPYNTLERISEMILRRRGDATVFALFSGCKNRDARGP